MEGQSGQGILASACPDLGERGAKQRYYRVLDLGIVGIAPGVMAHALTDIAAEEHCHGGAYLLRR